MRTGRWEQPYELVSRLIHAGEEETGFAILNVIDGLSAEDRSAVTGMLRRLVLPEFTREVVRKHLMRVTNGRDSVWQGRNSDAIADLSLIEFLMGDVLRDVSDSLRDAVYFFTNPANRSVIGRLRRATKRFCGDRAAECYYVIADSMRKLSAQGRYGTVGELAVMLYDHGLLDKDAKMRRFGEGGIVFEAGKRRHESAGKEVVIPPGAGNVVPYEWAIQAALRCGSLSASELSPRVRAGLLKLSDVCLLDLHMYLRGWTCHSNGLCRVIRTPRERHETEVACRRFLNLLIESRRDVRISSPAVSWIVPCEYINEPIPILLEACDVQDIGSHDVGAWLPWVSLSTVNCLRGWRNPLIGALRRAIFKLAHDFDPQGDARYPWELGFKTDTRFVPIETIYQYEPSALTLKGVRTLTALGFRSVNDLRFLHPAAVAAAKRIDGPLLKIYGRLRATGSNDTKRPALRSFPT